jgi:hypothetical protein
MNAKLFEGPRIPFGREVSESLIGLGFEETLLGDGLAHECSDERSDDLGRDVREVLSLDEFSEEGECFLGVVAAEVFDLSEDVLSVGGEEFVQEEGGIVAVRLPESG